MESASSNVLETILAKDTWTSDDHRDLMAFLYSTNHAVARWREVLSGLEAANPEPKGAVALKIGIARYMLCRFEEALSVFPDATDNKDRRYFAGQCHRSLHQYDKAIEEYDRAKSRGWDGPEVDVRIVECLAMSGRLDEAGKMHDKLAKILGGTADGLYLEGLLAELSGRGDEAISSYEKARQVEAGHSESTFRLAYYLDLHGQEEEAVELYKECLCRPPLYANALLNLAVLHEDVGQYDQAFACLKQLLTTHPNHPRARLFMRDVRASKTMYYDEDQAKRIAKRNAVLDIPVTDFELSVRARNCLKKMNINTLGDLVRTSEAELLGYKNFGETSLKEIKDMLTAKGLRLGQALEESEEMGDFSDSPAADSAPDDGVRSTPVEQIEFSIRARRVLEQLGVRTIGELANKSEAELLSQKNFGQTSLIELRQRLTEYGLNFRDAR